MADPDHSFERRRAAFIYAGSGWHDLAPISAAISATKALRQLSAASSSSKRGLPSWSISAITALSAATTSAILDIDAPCQE